MECDLHAGAASISSATTSVNEQFREFIGLASEFQKEINAQIASCEAACDELRHERDRLAQSLRTTIPPSPGVRKKRRKIRSKIASLERDQKKIGRAHV